VFVDVVCSGDGTARQYGGHKAWRAPSALSPAFIILGVVAASDHEEYAPPNVERVRPTGGGHHLAGGLAWETKDEIAASSSFAETCRPVALWRRLLSVVHSHVFNHRGNGRRARKPAWGPGAFLVVLHGEVAAADLAPEATLHLVRPTEWLDVGEVSGNPSIAAVVPVLWDVWSWLDAVHAADWARVTNAIVERPLEVRLGAR